MWNYTINYLDIIIHPMLPDLLYLQDYLFLFSNKKYQSNFYFPLRYKF